MTLSMQIRQEKNLSTYMYVYVYSSRTRIIFNYVGLHIVRQISDSSRWNTYILHLPVLFYFYEAHKL